MKIQNLVEEHLFLAELIAFDYANIPGCRWDEARSEASLALMRAAEAHDPSKGEFVSFSSDFCLYVELDLGKNWPVLF